MRNANNAITCRMDMIKNVCAICIALQTILYIRLGVMVMIWCDINDIGPCFFNRITFYNRLWFA